MNIKEMTELRDILSNLVGDLNIKIAQEKAGKATTIEETKNYLDVDRIEDYPGKNNDYLTYKIYLKGKHVWVPKSNLELDKCSHTRLIFKDDKIWTIEKLEWK